MDEYNREGDQGRCYVHIGKGVGETGPGVCPLCLNERLLVLAAAKRRASRKPSISLPSFFTFAAFLHRLHKSSSDPTDYSPVSTSPEDSFISIKINDSGVASWERNTASNKDNKFSLDRHSLYSKSHNSVSSNRLTNLTETTTKSVVERPQPVASLRWRKRIGHIFQFIRLKRSNNGDVCQVGDKVVEGLKLRKGWIRRLTTRRRPRSEGQEL